MDIFFDFDGTLAETSKGIVNGYEYAFEKYGGIQVSTETIRKTIGPPLKNAIHQMLPDISDEEVEKIGVLYREYYSEIGLYELEFYDGILDLLSYLRSTGNNLYILTSKPTEFVKRILEKYNISCFKDIIGIGLGFNNKNKTERFADYLKNNNLSAVNCVIVGDRLDDCKAADGNDVTFIGVLYGYGSVDEFNGHIACKDVNDLKKTIDDMMARSRDEYCGKLNNMYNTDELKRFIFPSKLFFGMNSISTLIDNIPENGAVIIADQFLENSDLFKQIIKTKDNAQVFYIFREPRFSDVDKIIDEIKGTPGAIVAIGGGSSIDVAKAIKSHYIYGSYKGIGYGDLRNIHTCMDPKDIPLIAAPTTPSSGAEQSRYYLIVDDYNNEKTVSRSWNIVPDVCVLVPEFLTGLPPSALVISVFDAFVHLFETYTCSHESSFVTSMVATHCITTIIRIMDWINTNHPERVPVELLLDLQLSASFGGSSLSNTRSGIIHNAGEFLSSFVRISHPMSLVVFYEEVFRYYDPVIKEKMLPVLSSINCYVKHIDSLDGIIQLWNDLFDYYGINEKIRQLLSSVEIDDEQISKHVFEDKVWVDKESPRLFEYGDICNIVTKSLQKYVK